MGEKEGERGDTYRDRDTHTETDIWRDRGEQRQRDRWRQRHTRDRTRKSERLSYTLSSGAGCGAPGSQPPHLQPRSLIYQPHFPFEKAEAPRGQPNAQTPSNSGHSVWLSVRGPQRLPHFPSPNTKGRGLRATLCLSFPSCKVQRLDGKAPLSFLSLTEHPLYRVHVQVSVNVFLSIEPFV